jgi:hypothetical protein
MGSTKCRPERGKEMATKDAEWTEATNGADANSADAWGNEVSEEVQITFTEEGDGFTAIYLEMDTTGTGIAQAHFENVVDLNGDFIGEKAFLNAGRDLARKLKSVPVKAEVRIQWKSSLPTGQKEPMRVYSVQWR